MDDRAAPFNVCPKCPASKGLMNQYQYVRHGSLRSSASCYKCPDAEHLHVSCNLCGYTVAAHTADDTAGEDVSQAKPIPKEMPYHA